MNRKKKRMSIRRRLFLMGVGYLSLALDKLEGKPVESTNATRKGRIKIVQ